MFRPASLSDLASFRGRIQHLPYVLPFVALLSSVIGSEADPDYDRAVPLPPIVGEAAEFIPGVLEEYAYCGRPLWPLVLSTLYAVRSHRGHYLGRFPVKFPPLVGHVSSLVGQL